MSDSEDVQSSSASTSRRSSYLTTSEEEDDFVMNDEPADHVVDGLVKIVVREHLIIRCTYLSYKQYEYINDYPVCIRIIVLLVCFIG